MSVSLFFFFFFCALTAIAGSCYCCSWVYPGYWYKIVYTPRFVFFLSGPMRFFFIFLFLFLGKVKKKKTASYVGQGKNLPCYYGDWWWFGKKKIFFLYDRYLCETVVIRTIICLLLFFIYFLLLLFVIYYSFFFFFSNSYYITICTYKHRVPVLQRLRFWGNGRCNAI